MYYLLHQNFIGVWPKYCFSATAYICK